MVLMLMRCARHVFVLVRARLAGHSRWRHRVCNGGARQKCQRAQQQLANLRMPQKLVQPAGLDKVRFTTAAPQRKVGLCVIICRRKHYCLACQNRHKIEISETTERMTNSGCCQ